MSSGSALLAESSGTIAAPGEYALNPILLGRDRLWPIQFWPISFWPSWFEPGQLWLKPIQFCQSNFGSGVCYGGAPKGRRAQTLVRPRRLGPRMVGGPKFRALFSLSRPPFSLFSLSKCFLVEFWWCFERRDPQMCTCGVLGLSCEPPAAPFHTNEKTPRERQNERKWGREREKKRHFGEFVAVGSGVGWSGGSKPTNTNHNTFNHNNKQQTTNNKQQTTNNNTTQKWFGPNWPNHLPLTTNWPLMDWPKLACQMGWSKMVWPKLVLVKVGLAKLGQKWIGQSWIGRSRP